MIEVSKERLHMLLPLFSTQALARACCEGLIPCRAFASAEEAPAAAVIVLRRFGMAFAAGDARHARALLEALRGWHSWYLFMDAPTAWHPALADWSPQGKAAVRYAFARDADHFDLDALRALAVPPVGCTLRAYDRQWLQAALAAPWSEDQLGAFDTPEDFLRDGFGLALVKDGALVAGCASFCRHSDGYEIQIDTHPGHRGQGYAKCVGAAFILAALEMGRFPYWDAANGASLRLAQALGYRFTHAYTAWVLVAEDEDAQQVAARAIGE